MPGLDHKSPPLVVLVDDDIDTRRIFSKFLGDEAIRVLSVGSAHECLQVLKGELVDLVLLDILMPDMDGLSVLREIRANLRTAELPVVIITALDDRVVLVEAKRLGALGCLIKPISRRQLLSSVRAQIYS